MCICAVSGVFVAVLFCVWCADFITCYFGEFWLRICAVFGKAQCLVWCCFAFLYVVYLVFFCILGVYLRCIKYSVFGMVLFCVFVCGGLMHSLCVFVLYLVCLVWCVLASGTQSSPAVTLSL